MAGNEKMSCEVRHCEECGLLLKPATVYELKRGRARYCSKSCAGRARVYPSIGERFWTKVRKTEGCWLWTAYCDRYGIIGNRGAVLKAHRVSWELHNGQIPDGLDVLHSCDNPPCVRPDHLFLGTHQDNMADKIAKGRHGMKRKEVCKHGHAMTTENVYVYGKDRQCLVCRRNRSREWTRNKARYVSGAAP